MSTFGFDDAPAPVPFKKHPLLIELVPEGSWGDNLRSRFTKSRWDSLRKAQYRKAGFRCEICGETGLQQGYEWPVECHEVWQYDDDLGKQTLERLIALCPGCHKVKHIGRTTAVEGPAGLAEALGRLVRVNGWTPAQAEKHMRDAFKIWERRSQRTWTLDISVIPP